MKIIGLTGGIGSGKSTVAKIFSKLGADVIDADEIAREIVEPGKITWRKLVSEFGKEMLNDDETLNRSLLAKVVFEDKTKRARINSIMHPRIQEEIISRIDKYRSDNEAKVVIIEAALLVERKGLLKLLDKLIVVSVDEKSRISRIKKRDNLSSEEILSRVRSQISDDQKAKLADFVVDNTGSIERTELQVKKIWKTIQTSTDRVT